ncbi:MAG: amidase [Acidobacteria bacterium]|nr:amidase [Acidobacteriota bacterium]
MSHHFHTETMAAAGARLRSGATTAVELTERCLAAIAEHGARTNAFITVHDAAARATASRLDAELRAGHDRGPLHGIPISLKDLIDEAGVLNTAGSKVLDDRVPAADAPLVARLREAGAIIIGRANLHEFALGTTSDDSGFGPVHNPHDDTRSPGGSSGGSAVSVATGMSIATIGTDTGGSIRIPAAACGLVGLKPSRGEVPNDGIVPLSASLDHAGPLALSVQDAAWVWQVLAGRPAAAIAPSHPRGLRLTRLAGYFDTPLEPAVRAAFITALDRLTAAGVATGRAELTGTERISQMYVNIVLPEAAHWHALYLDSRRDRYRPTVHARISHGRTINAVDYIDAIARCDDFASQVAALLESCDALVLPTLPITAPVIGQTDVVVDPATGVSLPVRAVMLKHTQLFNMTGNPAITLPIASPGLPIGLQLVGHRDGTEALLAVAAACEQVLGSGR